MSETEIPWRQEPATQAPKQTGAVRSTVQRAQHEPVVSCGAPGIAPFALLRAAGLPLRMLQDLRLPQTEVHVERIVAAEATLASQRQPAADALFAAVPQIAADDAATRRQVLALRRDIHNGRSARLTPALLELVRGLLGSGPGAAAFGAWADAESQRTQALDALEGGLREELQSVLRPALRRPLEQATFRRGLAFASPGVERSITREKRLPTAPTPDNLERSLLGYLARAAAKTSPFSSFMNLSVLELAPQGEAPFPRGERVAFANVVNFNRGAVARLHGRAVVDAARAGDWPLQLNATLRAGVNGRVHGLCSREVVLLGRPWWEQRFAQFRLEPALWERLTRLVTAPWDGWVQLLREQGLDAAGAETTVARLLERGVLLAPDFSDSFDEAPLDRLVAHWSRSASQALRARAPLLQQLQQQVAGVALAQGEERIALVDGIRTTQQAIEASFAPPAAEPLQNLVLEDCWLSGVAGAAGRSLLQPLEDLQTFLAGQVVESDYYRRLRDQFVARFGPGGHCDDAVDFLLRVSDKLIDVPEFGARWTSRVPLPARPGVRVPVTAQVQIAVGPHGRASSVVVNRVFDGAGWLAARFTAGDHPGQQALREQLSHWLRHVSGGREPVDVPVSGHCSDLQAHRPLTPRVLRWPGEPLIAPPERVIDAASLHLHHNPQTDLLDVSDQHGVPLNLMYLGTTFPSPIWGLRYALSILTQPYLIARPDFPPPAHDGAEPVRFEPRMLRGALVLRRSTWWVSARYLRECWFVGTPGERLLRARRESQRWNIPPVFFAQRHIVSERNSLISSDVLNANRKPMWIDIGNPFWLSMLERLTEEVEWLTFTEALPGPEDLWLKLDGQAHVSELQIEMLIEAGTPNSLQGDA